MSKLNMLAEAIDGILSKEDGIISEATIPNSIGKHVSALILGLSKAKSAIISLDGVYHYALNSTFQGEKTKSRKKVEVTYSIIKEMESSIDGLLGKSKLLDKNVSVADKEISNLFKKSSKTEDVDNNINEGISDDVSNLAAMKVLISLSMSVLKRMKGSNLFKFQKYLSDMNNMMDDEIDKMDNEQERQFNSMYMRRIRRVKSMIFESFDIDFDDDQDDESDIIFEENVKKEISDGMKMSGSASKSLMKAIGRIDGIKTGSYIGSDGWGVSGFSLIKDDVKYPVRIVVQYNDVGKNKGGYLVAFEVQTPMFQSGKPDYNFRSDLDDTIAKITMDIHGAKYIADRWSKLYMQVPPGDDPGNIVNKIIKEFPVILSKYIKEK